jgi:hypothetical protein
MSKESEKAIEEIIAYLESLGEEDLRQEKLPFIERLKCYCDFKSQIKSIWLTGYILIIWEDNFWETVNITWYRGGSYG